MGWSFYKTLEAKGPVAALEMALKTRTQTDQPLIHHSDRAGRPVPCSVLFGSLGVYMDRLRQVKITISMTESGDPNENALTERVFRTLKEEFHLWGFPTFGMAETAVELAIGAYNSVRPHASLDYKTAPRPEPNQAHQGQGYQPLKWYPYKKFGTEMCNIKLIIRLILLCKPVPVAYGLYHVNGIPVHWSTH